MTVFLEILRVIHNRITGTVADELDIQSPWFFKTWFWLLRWVVPISITIIFISNL